MAIFKPVQQRKQSEDGYMLLAVIFLMFLLALSLSIAAPMVAKSIQRDRELETMERGKQYQRAIQLYFRKFGTYPPSIDALVKTNNIRFLRKKYVDPMTGKVDWKPIMFGQAKAPMAVGFFGQPMDNGALAMAGTGPAGNNAPLPSSGFTGSSSGGGPLPGAGFGTPSTSGGVGGGFGTPPPTGGGVFGSSGGGIFGSSPSSGTGATGTAGGTSGTGTSGSSTGTTTSQPGGQTFGGAGIVGVEPPLDKQSILLYKKKNKYNEWEFTYSPITDQMKQQGGNAGMIGQPAASMGGQPGNSGGFGGSGGFGNSGGFGGSSGSGPGQGSFGSSPGGGIFGSSPGGGNTNNPGSGTNPPQQ